METTNTGGMMKDKIKTGARKLKNTVINNKVACVASAFAIAAVVLQQKNTKDFYKFLGERGIDPMEFYCPEMWEELNN